MEQERGATEEIMHVPWKETGNRYATSTSSSFSNLARSIGAPAEFLYFPLLSIAASMKDIKSEYIAKKEQTSNYWNIVAVRKGEKSQQQMRLLLHAVQKVEEVERERRAKDKIMPVP